ncbi:hypothetical protein GQ473_06830 [archaeon]|nr:hypothetical protein [archaeon]
MTLFTYILKHTIDKTAWLLNSKVTSITPIWHYDGIGIYCTNIKDQETATKLAFESLSNIYENINKNTIYAIKPTEESNNTIIFEHPDAPKQTEKALEDIKKLLEIYPGIITENNISTNKTIPHNDIQIIITKTCKRRNLPSKLKQIQKYIINELQLAHPSKNMQLYITK